jgi:hypothetical protein
MWKDRTPIMFRLLQPVNRGGGASVNTLAWRVTVAVAGMAVLGMTATLLSRSCGIDVVAENGE